MTSSKNEKMDNLTSEEFFKNSLKGLKVFSVEASTVVLDTITKFAVTYAERYCDAFNLPVEDTINDAYSEALVGLFTRELNCKCTYQVSLVIKGLVHNHFKTTIMNKYGISVNSIVPYLKMRTIWQEFIKSNARIPSFDELKKCADATNGQLYKFFEYNNIIHRDFVSIDDVEDDELYEYSDDIMIEIMHNLIESELEHTITTLTPREQKVIRMRMGFEDQSSKGLTLEEVGNIMGITREKVRQIEAKALRKMRHPSRSKDLKCYLD